MGTQNHPDRISWLGRSWYEGPWKSDYLCTLSCRISSYPILNLLPSPIIQNSRTPFP